MNSARFMFMLLNFHLPKLKIYVTWCTCCSNKKNWPAILQGDYKRNVPARVVSLAATFHALLEHFNFLTEIISFGAASKVKPFFLKKIAHDELTEIRNSSGTYDKTTRHFISSRLGYKNVCQNVGMFG